MPVNRAGNFPSNFSEDFLTDLIVGVMQAHDIGARTSLHEIYLLQQVRRIIHRNYFDSNLRTICTSLRTVHCTVRTANVIIVIVIAMSVRAMDGAKGSYFSLNFCIHIYTA